MLFVSCQTFIFIMRNFDQAYKTATKEASWDLLRTFQLVERCQKYLPGISIYKTENGYLKCNLDKLFELLGIEPIKVGYYRHSHKVSNSDCRLIYFCLSNYAGDASNFVCYLNKYNYLRLSQKKRAESFLSVRYPFDRLCDLLEGAFQKTPDLSNFGAVLKMRYQNGMPEILISYKNIIITVEEYCEATGQYESYQFPYGDLTFKWSFGSLDSVENFFLDWEKDKSCINLDNFNFISTVLEYSRFMLNKGHMYVSSIVPFGIKWRGGLCFGDYYSDIALAISNLDFFTLAYKVRKWLEYFSDDSDAYYHPRNFYMGAPKAYGRIALESATESSCLDRFSPRKKDCDRIRCVIRDCCSIYSKLKCRPDSPQES